MLGQHLRRWATFRPTLNQLYRVCMASHRDQGPHPRTPTPKQTRSVDTILGRRRIRRPNIKTALCECAGVFVIALTALRTMALSPQNTYKQNTRGNGIPSHLSQHEAFTQWCVKVGTASKTVDQHCTNIG